MQTRRERSEIFKVLREEKNKTKRRPRILYPMQLSFKSEGEIKTLTDKQNLREFLVSSLTLQEILKQFFREKENNIG